VNIVFIADFFADQILGGGELNNKELVELLANTGHDVKRINSHFVTREIIEGQKDSHFIVANFMNMPRECVAFLYDKKYIIYEHDHKYLINRNPALFKDFVAPRDQLINVGFYKKAKAVICQSQFHMDIIKGNLGFDNLISVGGNLWSEESLDLMADFAGAPKTDTCAILDSEIEHKNTREAVMYCEHKKLDYKLVKSDNYSDFLKLLGNHKTLVFLPKTPETLSRVAVEARMMGMSVIANKMIGATREPWFSQKGLELIETMRGKRKEIKDTVIGVFE
jgi:hypothetical protein